MPCSLSDYRLALIARDLDESLGDRGYTGNYGINFMVAPSFLIRHILKGKMQDEDAQISIDDAFGYFSDYRMEISFEIINRMTDIQILPATLETIFTKRDVLHINGKISQ